MEEIPAICPLGTLDSEGWIIFSKIKLLWSVDSDLTQKRRLSIKRTGKEPENP